MDLKKRWNEALKKHLRGLLETKPVIWQEILIANKGRVETSCMTLPADPSLDIESTPRFWNKMSGLAEEERTGMSDILHS